MGVGQILRDFAGWTSAHGIPHIGSANNNCLRIFWSIIFIASTAMFIWQMVLLIDKYQAYDVTVQTELKFEERNFPAVTICNLNPYDADNLTQTPIIQDLMNSYTLATKNRSALTGLDDPPRGWGFLKINASEGIALQAKARDHLLFVARYYEALKLLGTTTFSASDFIINCAYNTRPCARDTDFKQIVDPIYGNCFTFNFATQYRSTRAGPLYGLRLLAKSEQARYLPITESAGIRVAIHGQDEEPFPDAFGYNAAAGFTTSFGIKYIKTERLPAPYGNCTQTNSNGDYYYGGNYSVEGCFRTCYQKYQVEKCGCADPRFNTAKGSTTAYCVFNNTAQRDCTTAFSSSGATGFNAIDKCSCPQPCSESTYSVTVSTALWPSDVYTPPDCKNQPDPENCTAWYRENTMLIEVYYERMNYQLLSESEAYSLVNLISDTGGQLGLWMGFSVITMVEFLSLLVIVGCYFCNSRKQKSMTPVEPMNHPLSDKPPGTTPPPPYTEGANNFGMNNGDDLIPPKPAQH